MKKYTFLTFAMFIIMFLMICFFPGFALADTDNGPVFVLDNLVSKVTVSFESDSYENYYTKYTAKSPAVIRISNPSNLAYIDVYKVDTSEMINPNQYLYGSVERTPLKWDDKTYTVTIYNDNLEEIGKIDVKEHPGVRNYEITSGYITLTEPGLYLVSSTAWAASSDIYLVEVLDSKGNPADGVDRVFYKIIGLDNFKVQRKYTPDKFQDVREGAWYSKAVESCYELGLMEGKGNGKFDPQGNISVAEVLTIAARINKIYYGEGSRIEQTGSNWYDGAVYYAISRQIIYGDEFRLLTRPATRAEVAYIFANTLPDREFKKINNITRLPDVSGETKYNSEIFKLYNAGILTGQDQNLSFKPDANISRAEAAVIVTRLVKPDTRVIIPGKN